MQLQSDVAYLKSFNQENATSQTAVSQMQMTVSHMQVALTQLQKDVAELKSFNRQNATSQTAVSQMQAALMQLQSDVAELKSFNLQGHVEGMS